MKLLRLKLENFRQHRDSNIEFRDGMTAVVGANGTGKTTLLEAITFALYGEQRDNLDNIKFYWSEGKRYSVTLRFEFGGSIFEVTRSHVDASLCEITENGSVTYASSKTDVKKACERLLGLNYEQFINSFCAEQKNLGFLNFKTSTAQQDEVARMLGFDRLKDAEELARNRRRAFESEIKGGRSMLGDPIELETQKSEAKKSLDEVTEKIRLSQIARAEILRQIPEAQIARERSETFIQLTGEMRAIEAKAEGLKTALKHAEEAFAIAQKDSLERETLEGAEKEFQEFEKQLGESEKLRESGRQREALLQQKETLEKEVARLTEKAAETKAPDLARVEAALTNATRGETKGRSDVALQEQLWKKRQMETLGPWKQAIARAEQLQKDLNKAEVMVGKGICPECGQPVSVSMKAGLAKRRADWEAADAERLKQEKLHNELEGRPEALVTAGKALEEAVLAHKAAQEAKQQAALDSRALDDIKSELMLKDRAMRELVAGLAVIPSTYDQERHASLIEKLALLKPQHERYLALADSVTRLRTVAERKESAQRELESEKTRYVDFKAQRSSTGFVADPDAQAAILAYERLSSDLKVHDAALESNELARSQAATRLAEAEKRLEERAQREKELKELEKLEALHDAAQRELKTLREELNRTIKPDLIARASENLSILTNGRYPLLDLDKNFKPILLDDNVEKHVISGGEEDVVALSLRLALSELIQEMSGHPMSLLILDEVFGSLDAERRQSVLERLIGLKNRFAQIFIISHIEEINQIADQCIYLTRDPDTKATIVADAMPEQIALEL